MVDAYYRGNKDICSFEQIIANMTLDSVCNSYYPVVVTNLFSENLHLYAGVMIASSRILGRMEGKLAKCLPHHGQPLVVNLKINKQSLQQWFYVKVSLTFIFIFKKIFITHNSRSSSLLVFSLLMEELIYELHIVTF